MSIDLKGQIDDVLKGSVELLTGGSANIQSKTIYENGTYNPPSGVDGFAPVIVDVPQLLLEDKYINENGQFGPSEGYDGMRSVTVEVPVPSILPLTITENGVYESTGGSGFNPITVNVQGGVNVYTETYTGNGTAGHVITFEHEPKTILRISGAIDSSNICWTVGNITPECNRVRVNVGDSSQYTIQIAMSGNTMTLLQASYDAGANLNYNGVTYTVTYLA
jgi:hypothetical protein